MYGPELMLCAASVRIGPARQTSGRCGTGKPGGYTSAPRSGKETVRLARGRVDVAGSGVSIALALEEVAGVETVCRSGQSYAWTRKQGGVRAHGAVELGGRRIALDASAP